MDLGVAVNQQEADHSERMRLIPWGSGMAGSLTLKSGRNLWNPELVSWESAHS